jgi:phage tail-like protein
MGDKVLRPFTGGQFMLELDGTPVGMLSSIDGGHFKSDEVKYQTGVTEYLNVVTKYPSKPKYEDITFSVGTATSPGFWDWVKSTLDNEPERRNGAIVTFDYKMRERQRREFFGALISEIGFPALDAGSKTPAALNIKISPERLRFKDGDGSHRGNPSYGNDAVKKQKLWLCNNFNFSLERFKGDPALMNAKIEGFTIKHAVNANPIGRMLETHKYAGLVETPNIQVSFPQSQVKPWMEWYEKCVRHGNYIGELTTGSIVYYASDGNTELMTLHLDNVGITSLEFDKLEAHKEGIARVKATLYVESIRLETEQGTVGDS